MNGFFKVIHIIGLAMFLGSILAHITVGRLPGAATDPASMLFAREAIDLATRFVTLPGLALAIGSGIFLVAGGSSGFFTRAVGWRCTSWWPSRSSPSRSS